MESSSAETTLHSRTSCKTPDTLGRCDKDCRVQTEEKKVRKKLMGGRYLMLETRKDGTKFTTKALKEAAERLQGISRSYDQRQHALVEQVQGAAPPTMQAMISFQKGWLCASLVCTSLLLECHLGKPHPRALHVCLPIVSLSRLSGKALAVV